MLRDSADWTAALAGLPENYFPPATGSPLVENNVTEKFTEELRMSGSIGRGLDFMLGGFFGHEASPYTQSFLAEDVSTGEIVGTGITFDWHDTFREYAAFANLTVHFSPFYRSISTSGGWSTVQIQGDVFADRYRALRSALRWGPITL
jgi:hypothetical protein